MNIESYYRVERRMSLAMPALRPENALTRQLTQVSVFVSFRPTMSRDHWHDSNVSNSLSWSLKSLQTKQEYRELLRCSLQFVVLT